MGNVTWKGFVTESTINSVEYGLLCSSNSSTPLEVASPLPLETIPENATIAKAEDLFPEDHNNYGLLYPREILETETLNDRENEEFGDY